MIGKQERYRSWYGADGCVILSDNCEKSGDIMSVNRASPWAFIPGRSNQHEAI